MERETTDLKRRVYLRSKFEDGDRPDGQAFTDLIDSSLNQKSDKIFAVDQKIGIGTDAPSAPLEVFGAEKNVNQSFLATDGNNSTFRVAHPEEGVASVGSNQSEKLQLGKFKKNGASFVAHMTLEPSGNIGIGIDEPEEKLAIEGSLMVTQDLLIGACKLSFKNGKLLLYTDETCYQVALEDVGSKPQKPRKHLGLRLVVLLLCVLTIILLLVIYYLYTQNLSTE